MLIHLFPARWHASDASAHLNFFTTTSTTTTKMFILLLALVFLPTTHPMDPLDPYKQGPNIRVHCVPLFPPLVVQNNCTNQWRFINCITSYLVDEPGLVDAVARDKVARSLAFNITGITHDECVIAWCGCPSSFWVIFCSAAGAFFLPLVVGTTIYLMKKKPTRYMDLVGDQWVDDQSHHSDPLIEERGEEEEEKEEEGEESIPRRSGRVRKPVAFFVPGD